VSGPPLARAGSGGREYVRPSTGQTAPSVTTVLGILDKPALPRWSALEVARYAVDNRAAWEQLDPPAAVDLLKRAPWRKTTEAADTGTDLHAVAETLLAGGDPPDAAPAEWVARFRAFLDTWRPEPLEVEATVWGDVDGLPYGGTCDLLADVPGVGHLVVDLKTGRGVYPEVSLQLAAYGYADTILRPDGSEAEWPQAAAAAVLHVPATGTGWSLRRVDVGPHARAGFEHARHLFEWRQVYGPAAIHPQTGPHALGDQHKTPHTRKESAA